MANEYVFNYDEVKRRFESVPSTNSMNKKLKSTTTMYKTHFQPRTKSVIEKNERRTSFHPIGHNRYDKFPTPKMMFQLQVIRVPQTIHQQFYIIP